MYIKGYLISMFKMQCLHFRLKVEQIIPISRERACVMVQTYFEKAQMVCVRDIGKVVLSRQ